MTGAFDQAVAYHQQGQLGPAEALYRAVLQAAPRHVDALHNLGVLDCQRGNFAQAAALFAQAVAISPGHASAHANLGIALAALKRPADALASYDRSLALAPDVAPVLYARGTVLLELSRPEDALASYDRVLALDPGNLLAHYAQGAALRKVNRHKEALASYDRALALDPAYADAWSNRGNCLRELNRHEAALASYDRALALKPDHFEALNNRGTALMALGRGADAIASQSRALALNPDHVEVLNNRATALLELGRPDEAAADFERLLALEPDFDAAPGDLFLARLYAGDWRGYDAALTRLLAAGPRAATPFALAVIADAPADQLRRAASYNRRKFPAAPALWRGERFHHDRIRIAYVSADLHNHATAHLMAELFETHDRSRFEITALSYGPAAADAYRTRLKAAFEHFIDIRQMSDADAAALMRQREIDIAIDLKGYTQYTRLGIFARRPAPIQVGYLGYPGTSGADYMDYLLADRIVIPEAAQDCYSERIVYLPDSYQPNDRQRRIADHMPSRRDAGLPETGFVFCSFNSLYKITPPVFAIWMRLLHQIEGSVLWLRAGAPIAANNLRRSAAAAGIAPERLVFAPSLPLDAHLARHRLADLFLDTLPCNAHTTASDALWAGLPVLTCPGGSFAGRVAASLLNAVGLPDLVAETLGDYEAIALRLAREPDRLNELAASLARNRSTAPLFDTERLCRHLESAYREMWQRHLRGEQPASFAVPSGGII